MWNRRKHKFGAKRVECDCPIGMHPSMLERSVCKLMALRERAGEIREIKRQATVHMPFGVNWKLDFRFQMVATGQTWWAEAKGAWQPDAKQKLKMWRNGAGPGPLEIWQGSHQRPKLVETVIPKSTQTHEDAQSGALVTEVDQGTGGDNITKGNGVGHDA